MHLQVTRLLLPKHIAAHVQLPHATATHAWWHLLLFVLGDPCVQCAVPCSVVFKSIRVQVFGAWPAFMLPRGSLYVFCFLAHNVQALCTVTLHYPECSCSLHVQTASHVQTDGCGVFVA